MDDEDDATADSLLRAAAYVAPIAVPAELATLVLLEPGAIIDGLFRIEERLGAGGMGVVYAARDLRLDREVAIKLMRLERGTGTIGRTLPDVFEREARATARLNHENVVTLHQFGDWNGLVYLVLERLRGETLHARLERGPLPLDEGLAIVEHVARALVHTHAAGVLHRDLKPHNVFLSPGGRVKVLDFGVSGLALEASAGTPGYMAPEQWRGEEQDARTDVWAAGVMLYQLATGALPFGRGAVAADAVAPRLPRDRDGLAALIARCLAVDRERRLGSAAELAAELAEVRARPRRRRRRRWLGAGAVVLAAAATAAVIELRGRAGGTGACDHGEARLAGIWDGAVKARLRGGVAGPAWTEIERVLDRYAREWITVEESTCRAARRRDRAAAAAADRCLDERRDALAAWTAGPLTDDAAAIASLRSLPPVSECVDATYLASRREAGARLRDGDGPVRMALSIGGPDHDIIHGGAIVGGDLVMIGHTGGAARIGRRELGVAAGNRGGFVARLDELGEPRWQVVLASSASSQVVGLAVGRHGDLLVTGMHSGAVAVAGRALLPAPPGEADCFVMSLDAATGAVRWAHGCGATVLAGARAIAVDGAGNAIITGEFGGVATFGGATAHDAHATPERVPFVASWTAAGALRWVTPGRRTANARMFTVAADGDTVVVGGYTQGAGTLGGHALATGGCLIARLDAATGAVRWIREWPGESGRCMLRALALHGDRIGVTGQGASRLGGAWIGELALADGATRWNRSLTVQDNRGMAALFTPAGELLAAGMFSSKFLDVDGVQIANSGAGGDGYVLRFDAAGTCTGGLAVGGSGGEMLRWLALTPEGHVLAGGRYQNTMNIADRTMRAIGSYDGFAVELTPAAWRRR